MQTFLPYDDFVLSLDCLDYRRLGKQRVEAMQLLNAMKREKGGWINHPATKMWRGYEVVSGDESDVRILDPIGVIIALHAKGEARTDTSNFVIHALGIHADQVTW